MDARWVVLADGACWHNARRPVVSDTAVEFWHGAPERRVVIPVRDLRALTRMSRP